MNLIQQLARYLDMQKLGEQLLQIIGVQRKNNTRSRWIFSFLSIVAAVITLGFLRNQRSDFETEQSSADAKLTTEDIMNNTPLNSARLNPLIEMANEFAPTIKK